MTRPDVTAGPIDLNRSPENTPDAIGSGVGVGVAAGTGVAVGVTAAVGVWATIAEVIRRKLQSSKQIRRILNTI